MDFSEIFDFVQLRNIWDYLVLIYLSFGLLQLLTYLVVFGRFAFAKKKQKEEKSNLPVSIVICARNERENLLNLLPEFLSQDYPEFEVVVVDDHSIDDTQDVLKAFSLQHNNLKVVKVPDNDRFFGSKKFALTLGIKAAKYDHVLLSDADCRPASNQWVNKMTLFEGKKQIVLGYGAYEKKKGILNRLIRFETVYTAMHYLSLAMLKVPYMGVGRNLAYNKELFFENKGFASHQHILSGDDDLFINEVANAHNTEVSFETDAHTISVPKESWGDWVRQKKRHFLTGGHYKFKHQLILGAIQLFQIIFMGLFVVLIIQQRPIHLILGVFVLRYMVQMLIFKLSTDKLGGRDLLAFVPFFEVFFMLFNPLLFFSNLIIKKTKWS